MEQNNDYSYISNFNIGIKPEMKLISYIDIKLANAHDMLDQESE